jgi:hypothetical protein
VHLVQETLDARGGALEPIESADLHDLADVVPLEQDLDLWPPAVKPLTVLCATLHTSLVILYGKYTGARGTGVTAGGYISHLPADAQPTVARRRRLRACAAGR